MASVTQQPSTSGQGEARNPAVAEKTPWLFYGALTLGFVLLVVVAMWQSGGKAVVQ